MAWRRGGAGQAAAATVNASDERAFPTLQSAARPKSDVAAAAQPAVPQQQQTQMRGASRSNAFSLLSDRDA